MFCKKGVLRKFAKFTRKHLCQKPEACNFIKKETLAQVFSCEFYKISKNTFFSQNTSGGCFFLYSFWQFFLIYLLIGMFTHYYTDVCKLAQIGLNSLKISLFDGSCQDKLFTASKVSLFGVFLVRVFARSDWIRRFFSDRLLFWGLFQ